MTKGHQLTLLRFGGRIPEADAAHSCLLARCTEHQEETMSIAELVYEQVKALPEPLAREVLDFIGFLRERGERRAWRDLMSAQAVSLAPVWDNAEDKVWDDV